MHTHKNNVDDVYFWLDEPVKDFTVSAAEPAMPSASSSMTKREGTDAAQSCTPRPNPLKKTEADEGGLGTTSSWRAAWASSVCRAASMTRIRTSVLP